MYQDEGMEGGSRGGFERRGGRGGGRGGGMYAGSGAPKPVKPGDEVEVEVEAVASKGDGIAKKDGFVIFIKGAQQGQKVKVRISEVKERFAVGEIIA
ncbi:MAG: TRAM domain-containing protein [Candidatus Micrarchaeales archaeon]|nr:TRAM domain-containing protein [Candidatus Micrarchaeales archaeon]